MEMRTETYLQKTAAFNNEKAVESRGNAKPAENTPNCTLDCAFYAFAESGPCLISVHKRDIPIRGVHFHLISCPCLIISEPDCLVVPNKRGIIAESRYLLSQCIRERHVPPASPEFDRTSEVTWYRNGYRSILGGSGELDGLSGVSG